MKYMVALDSSEHSNKAFSTAASLIKENDVLLLATVIASKTNKAHDKQRQQAEKMLESFVTKCRETGILGGVDTLILEGNDARDALCTAVEAKEVGVLVVGTRGLGCIKRTLLGSVSSHAVQHAHCDVIVAK